MTKPKMAPVQGYSAGIPWEMHLRAYDGYCKKWGKQEALIDLDGRNCRGGFGTSELDEFIPGWREELKETTQLKARIAELEATRSDAHLLRSHEAALELLRQWRMNQYPRDHAKYCKPAAKYPDWPEPKDDRCDLCKRTDAALTEAAALEPQKEQPK